MRCGLKSWVRPMRLLKGLWLRLLHVLWLIKCLLRCLLER